jgi:uncharacterized protein
MRQVLAIFGKMPLKGFSKTRLSKDVGEEMALKLYGAFIKDFAQNLREFGYFESIYIFGSPDNLATENFFRQEFLGFNIKYFPQSEIPFFSRLQEVFQKIKELEGDCFIHLTGTDIPDFPFDQLAGIEPMKNTVYLGPDIDGGFYYVGAQAKSLDIFSFQISGSILESISRTAKDLGYEVSHLKTWSDIDDLTDLEAALARAPQEKISHTRALWPH